MTADHAAWRLAEGHMHAAVQNVKLVGLWPLDARKVCSIDTPISVTHL